MASLYVFLDAGFFPVAGQAIYYLHGPRVGRASFYLNNGKTFTIIGENASPENIYIQSVTLNGKPLKTPSIRHEDIMAGGVLDFKMGPKPSKWGFSGAFPESTATRGSSHRFKYLLDMVHNNPGEPATVTRFNDPQKLLSYGYNHMVVNDFVFVHSAITFDKLNPEIFPQGSESRKWVEKAAANIDRRIEECHKAGLKCLFFTDIIVLPKRLKEIYHDEICDSRGNIDIHRPKTQEIHRYMIREIFERFPGLDGLVVRTGETYLQNTPYHTGNNPITQGALSHKILINLLRDEVCVKANKLLIYRTWSFDGFHTDPAYYLKVTDQIEPHPNLIFSIKHTGGDYWRTFPVGREIS